MSGTRTWRVTPPKALRDRLDLFIVSAASTMEAASLAIEHLEKNHGIKGVDPMTLDIIAESRDKNPWDVPDAIRGIAMCSSKESLALWNKPEDIALNPDGLTGEEVQDWKERFKELIGEANKRLLQRLAYRKKRPPKIIPGHVVHAVRHLGVKLRRKGYQASLWTAGTDIFGDIFPTEDLLVIDLDHTRPNAFWVVREGATIIHLPDGELDATPKIRVHRNHIDPTTTYNTSLAEMLKAHETRKEQENLPYVRIARERILEAVELIVKHHGHLAATKLFEGDGMALSLDGGQTKLRLVLEHESTEEMVKRMEDDWKRLMTIPEWPDR